MAVWKAPDGTTYNGNPLNIGGWFQTDAGEAIQMGADWQEVKQDTRTYLDRIGGQALTAQEQLRAMGLTDAQITSGIERYSKSVGEDGSNQSNWGAEAVKRAVLTGHAAIEADAGRTFDVAKYLNPAAEAAQQKQIAETVQSSQNSQSTLDKIAGKYGPLAVLAAGALSAAAGAGAAEGGLAGAGGSAGAGGGASITAPVVEGAGAAGGFKTAGAADVLFGGGTLPTGLNAGVGVGASGMGGAQGLVIPAGTEFAGGITSNAISAAGAQQTAASVFRGATSSGLTMGDLSKLPTGVPGSQDAKSPYGLKDLSNAATLATTAAALFGDKGKPLDLTANAVKPVPGMGGQDARAPGANNYRRRAGTDALGMFASGTGGVSPSSLSLGKTMLTAGKSSDLLGQ